MFTHLFSAYSSWAVRLCNPGIWIMKKRVVVLCCLLPMLSLGEADFYRLSWRSDPATSMVIGWNQVSGTEPVLYYDTVDHGDKVSAYTFNQAPDRVVDYREMNNHFVRLENLKPDTAYYFLIRDSEGVGRRLWFRTAPATKKPFTFISGGDSRTNPEPRREGNKLVAKLRPLFVLFGGDYTGSGKPNEWKGWFADWQLTISEDGRIYPIIATHGNHENADLQMMDKLFDTPHLDQYYSFGFAGELMRIWVLNSELEAKAKDKVPEQQAWIESALPRFPDAKWKVATYHRPMRPHTAGKKEGVSRIKAWAQLFYDQGVDLVVESDTHMVKSTYPLRPSTGEGSYESFVRDDAHGVVFIGEGSWGAPKRPATDDKPWTMASDSFYQFKWIQVYPDELFVRTVKFENVDAVESLTEQNLFEEPDNMVFWEPDSGKVLRLPFDVNHETYQEPAKPHTLVDLGGAWEWSLDRKSWTEGMAPLGYGDDQIKTVVAADDIKPLFAFFRKEFQIEDPARVSRLFFDAQVDDGCAIWLNGKLVRRHNLPKGPITNATRANRKVEGWEEQAAMPLPIDPGKLQTGTNTIIVRVLQADAESEDLIFDLGIRVKEVAKEKAD
jgi:hypothetical protein